MKCYVTCSGCSSLIDMFPEPMPVGFNGTCFIDTTITIDSFRYCRGCGEAKLEGKAVIRGYDETRAMETK